MQLLRVVIMVVLGIVPVVVEQLALQAVFNHVQAVVTMAVKDVTIVAKGLVTTLVLGDVKTLHHVTNFYFLE